MKSLSVGKDIEKSKTVCRIFGILLDNAIEATLLAEKPSLVLAIFEENDMVVVIVENSIA